MRWKSIWHKDWQRRFAFGSVVLDDKTEVWLTFYYQRYIEKTVLNEKEFSDRQVGRWERVAELPSK